MQHQKEVEELKEKFESANSARERDREENKKQIEKNEGWIPVNTTTTNTISIAAGNNFRPRFSFYWLIHFS